MRDKSVSEKSVIRDFGEKHIRKNRKISILNFL